MFLLVRLLVVALVIMNIMLFNLGMDYIELGYGLHPFIAFTWFVLNIVFIIWIMFVDFKEWSKREHANGVWVAK